MVFLLVIWALTLEALFVYIAAFGLLWAPVGALICAWIAKSKGMPVKVYAVQGTAYSMLLFFPWVYFTMQISGRPIPISCIIAGYVALYGFWFAIILAKFAAISIEISGPNEIAALLHSTLLIVSIIQFHLVSPYTTKPLAAKFLKYARLSPFFYMSIGLFLQLAHNISSSQGFGWAF